VIGLFPSGSFPQIRLPREAQIFLTGNFLQKETERTKIETVSVNFVISCWFYPKITGSQPPAGAKSRHGWPKKNVTWLVAPACRVETTCRAKA
jgi:hypothetical protein